MKCTVPNCIEPVCLRLGSTSTPPTPLRQHMATNERGTGWFRQTLKYLDTVCYPLVLLSNMREYLLCPAFRGSIDV